LPGEIAPPSLLPEPLPPQLGLSPQDLRDIAAGLGRTPRLAELWLFSAMWSEHCSYRHSRPYLRHLTSAATGPQVVQGPGENAGILDLGGGLGVAVKVESHNHPSAVDPYQGAATGVGGILRDIAAMGARPIALLDGLFLGPAEDPHARWLSQGIVAGVGGYGNAVGVPTVGGLTCVDPGYVAQPLVNVMAVGLLPLDRMVRSRATQAGNLLVLLGARTGRDGVGGARFASEELHQGRLESLPAVQVGDPFAEKRLLDAMEEAVERGLIRSAQDMGAAGILSSTSELCYRGNLGCRLDLDAVPLRQEGLSAWEILLSESQERMLVEVCPQDLPAIQDLARRYGLEAAVLGEVEVGLRYRVRHQGRWEVDLPLPLLCEAPPLLPPTFPPPPPSPSHDLPLAAEDVDLPRALVEVWEAMDLADTQDVYERYDTTVGARTALGPPGGAAVLLLGEDRPDALAVSLDANARYALTDPRRAAALTVVEGVQNLAAVGAKALGITDGLNLPDPDTPYGRWALKASVEGLAEACRALGLPVVSGNVSMYNEGPRGPVPVATVVGTVGILPRVEKALEAGFTPGQVLVQVGDRCGWLGASVWDRWRHGQPTWAPPPVDYDQVQRAANLLREAHARGLVGFALDAWTGGLWGALVRGLGPKGAGAELTFPALPPPQRLKALLGEGPGRYLVGAAPEAAAALVALAREAGVPAQAVGQVTSHPHVRLRWKGEEPWCVDLSEVRARRRKVWV
jgi:phosphoribosylformylglycinamidine synthase II